ncbi:cupin domain-containing protein [Nocardioides carbamazepini]|uniref:cupin domain-containing protein n=1 Tax=Nocardioides carbamazepini TaxID=2854259 RepID=UPI00214A85BA|nr:cupin domain-containing protein [Nocardioides carbamazepini]MCR1783787.1 cupin domain-containing protein [Nocardioides carbamazepini]
MSERHRIIPEGMQARTVAIADGDEIPGRRTFAQYFDLGVAEASKGLVSTQVTRMKKGMSEETGWHYHDCDFQWLLVTKGWLELTFEDGETKRVDQNGMCFIPGGYRHNETGTSDDLEFIEIFMPPNPPTVKVESPL